MFALIECSPRIDLEKFPAPFFETIREDEFVKAAFKYYANQQVRIGPVVQLSITFRRCIHLQRKKLIPGSQLNTCLSLSTLSLDSRERVKWQPLQVRV